MEPLYINTTANYEEIKVTKVKTPDYAERIAKGIPLPVNPYFMSYFKSNGANKGALLTTQYYDKSQAVTTQTFEPGVMTGPNSSDCNNMIGELNAWVTGIQQWKSNTLLSKIKKQSLPLLMMYKERHQTGKLITKFLDDALYCVGNLKHPKRVLLRMGVYDPQRHSGNFLRKLRKNTMSCETAGDAWLQYRFAWTPLYHDIEDSVKSAAEFEEKLQKHSQNAGTKFACEASKNMYDWLQGERVWRGNIEGAVSYRVNYFISDSTLAAVGSMMDIPTTLWDAVPWSFVIDRVVNVSNYLDLRNATLGTEFTSGFFTTFYRRTILPAAISVSYYPDRLRYLYGGRKYVKQFFNPPPREDVYLNRIKLTSFPTPILEYPLSFKVEHGVDYMALGRQVLSKFRKRPRF